MRAPDQAGSELRDIVIPVVVVGDAEQADRAAALVEVGAALVDVVSVDRAVEACGGHDGVSHAGKQHVALVAGLYWRGRGRGTTNIMVVTPSARAIAW